MAREGKEGGDGGRREAAADETWKKAGLLPTLRKKKTQ